MQEGVKSSAGMREMYGAVATAWQVAVRVQGGTSGPWYKVLFEVSRLLPRDVQSTGDTPWEVQLLCYIGVAMDFIEGEC